MQRAKTRKRPCTICRRWFTPDQRQLGRQKTCGRSECQNELHRRQCRNWNHKNREYFKAIYLSEKLSRTKDPPDPSQERPPPVIPASRINLGLPKDVIIPIIGTEQMIILDYIIEQIIQSKLSAWRPHSSAE
jgi:hypothetical protein